MLNVERTHIQVRPCARSRDVVIALYLWTALSRRQDACSKSSFWIGNYLCQVAEALVLWHGILLTAVVCSPVSLIDTYEQSVQLVQQIWC